MTASDLTNEQNEIATAPVRSRQLVSAGPGTGKTHTLVSRISHLIDSEDTAVGTIIALSFSRAAVMELRKRLRSSDSAAARVLPVTFDSFATRILSEVDPQGSWAEGSYDDRIASATDQIHKISELFADIEHICVDEVQDLVGVRMHFVTALLEHVGVGFTLLGDQAQSIYDFTLNPDQDPSEHGSPAFNQWLRTHFGEDLVERTLTVNHRSTAALPLAAAALGPRVIEDTQAASTSLMAIVEELPEMQLESLRHVSTSETTAVLCRNNGTAMLVSRQLLAAGVQHTLQRRATDRLLDPLLTVLLNGSGGGLISRERFDRSSKEWAATTRQRAVWTAMRRIARGDGPTVDLDLLLRRLRSGVIPDELQHRPPSPVTVSTIHRAKGLEFDRVVVLSDDWALPLDDESAKTLFVALTRAKQHLLAAAAPEYSSALRKNRRDRWYQGSWQSWQRHGFEVQLGDIDMVEPGGGSGYGLSEIELQTYLRTEVKSGDPVTVEFERMRMGNPPLPAYLLKHQEHTIAVMSDQFSSALAAELKGAQRNWKPPKVIDGLSIECVRTIVGDPHTTNQAGLGPGGAWLAPAVAGLGHLVWKETD